MKSPYNGIDVNGTGVKPDAWYCDICGGYFTVDEAGYISDEDGCADICEECRGQNFHSTAGEIIN